MKMGNSPVDRDVNYMREQWGTTSLVTDHWSLPGEAPQDTPVELKEVLNDEAKPVNGDKKQMLSEESPYDSIPNRY
tara:strand:+ start:830 stop:1057 length:228 start_codon:yes stop_codon:yes gene_type:complete